MLIDAGKLLRELEAQQIALAIATLERPQTYEKYMQACGEYKALRELQNTVKTTAKENEA